MALTLKGGELIVTEALSARVLSNLVALAARGPLMINGLRLCAKDLERLAEEAWLSSRPVWIGEPAGAARDAN